MRDDIRHGGLGNKRLGEVMRFFGVTDHTIIIARKPKDLASWTIMWTE